MGEARALRKKQETKEIIAVTPKDLVEVKLEHPLTFDGKKTTQVVVQTRAEGGAQKDVVEITEIVAQQARHAAADDEARADDEVHVLRDLGQQYGIGRLVIEIGIHDQHNC